MISSRQSPCQHSFQIRMTVDHHNPEIFAHKPWRLGQDFLGKYQVPPVLSGQFALPANFPSSFQIHNLNQSGTCIQGDYKAEDGQKARVVHSSKKAGSSLTMKWYTAPTKDFACNFCIIDRAHPSLCLDKEGLKRAASIRSSGGSTNFSSCTVYFTSPVPAIK